MDGSTFIVYAMRAWEEVPEQEKDRLGALSKDQLVTLVQDMTEVEDYYGAAIAMVILAGRCKP